MIESKKVNHISPNQTLVTEPFVTIKIIQLHNAYKPSDKSNYNLYMNMGLDLNNTFKTQCIPNTPNPEFSEQNNYSLQAFRNATFFNLSVYDKDDFGSDVFIANQILPTQYFIHQFNKKQKNFKISFFLDEEFNFENEFIDNEEATLLEIEKRLGNKKYMNMISYPPQSHKNNSNYSNKQSDKDANSISNSSPSSRKDSKSDQLSSFNKSSEKKNNINRDSCKSADQKEQENYKQQQHKKQQQEQEIHGQQPSTEQNNSDTKEQQIKIENEEIKSEKLKQNLIYLTVEVIIMDVKQLYKLTCDVVSLNETKQEGVFSENTVYYYELFIKRNDGLCWRLQRRYKQIRKFRDECVSKLEQVKNIDFPSRDLLLHIKGLVSLTSPEDLKQQGQKRKEELQTFFNKILQIDLVYSLEAFETFFSYN